MKRILILLVLICLTLPVFAANWVQYTQKGWYDIASWKYDGKSVSVWFKDLNPGNWELVNNKKIWFKMVLMQAKCGQRQINIKHYTEYDIKGNVLFSFTPPYEDWQDIVPDTIGEQKYNIMCSAR